MRPSRKEKTLYWINRLREEGGYPPLSELKKGVAASACECPIANSLRVDESDDGFDYVAVSPTQVWYYDGENHYEDGHKIPKDVRKFIMEVDRLEHPDLVYGSVFMSGEI